MQQSRLREQRELTIREYRASDYDTCRGLWVELTQHHQEIYDDPAIGGEDPGSDFDVFLANSKRRGAWVAMVSGAVVGMAGLLMDGPEAELEPLVVAREMRGQGIGLALVTHVREQARELGVRSLQVRPVARNASAFAFYVQAGFDIVGYIELFQEIGPGDGRRRAGSRWITGMELHGKALRY